MNRPIGDFHLATEQKIIFHFLPLKQFEFWTFAAATASAAVFAVDFQISITMFFPSICLCEQTIERNTKQFDSSTHWNA